MPSEEWRPVPLTEFAADYTVSSLGRVWSRPRERTRGGVMRLRPSTRGRLEGRLVVSLGGHSRLVTHLVADAFLGPRPAGQVVRHLNGDYTDNRVANLAYGSQRENMQDCLQHGRNPAANKEFCIAGHELTEANTVLLRPSRQGWSWRRQCRKCTNRRNRERRARLVAERTK